MNGEGGPVTVFLLIGSSFFLVSSALATVFPPLVFVSPLWAPFGAVSSSYLALAACLWSLTVLSFYLTERVSSGYWDAYIPLVPAVISALLFLPIAMSVVGVAGLSGTAFCALSFAVAVAGYRARVGFPAQGLFIREPAVFQMAPWRFALVKADGFLLRPRATRLCGS